MKTLFDADMLMENPNNKVYSEKIKNIKPNVPYYIEHSIYFAETLSVFQDETKTTPLVLGADYEYAQFDSIATEQSNKDCCRAILFLRPFPAVYIDYHSYGDLITADLFNGVFADVTELNSKTKQIKTDLEDLSENVKQHISDTKPHASNESVTPGTLALRSSSGTLKAAEAELPEELATLSQVERKTGQIKTEANAQIIKTKEQLEEKIETKIAELINNAPAELDTLKELADALNKNKDGISAINTALANRYTKAEADNIFTAKTGTYLKSEIDKKDKDTLEAAKTYLNSGIIDDVVEKSVKKIDGLSGSWKQECKTYTDSKVGSEAASRKTEDERTLSGAKEYTDKKTEQALLEHYTKYGYVQFQGMSAPHFINLLYYRWKQIRKFSIYIRLDNVSLSEKVTIWQLEYIPPSVQQ